MGKVEVIVVVNGVNIEGGGDVCIPFVGLVAPRGVLGHGGEGPVVWPSERT